MSGTLATRSKAFTLRLAVGMGTWRSGGAGPRLQHTAGWGLWLRIGGLSVSLSLSVCVRLCVSE